jgi:hypothetical protein
MGTNAIINTNSVGLAFDASGTLWFADTGVNRIRSISPSGNVTTRYGWTAGYVGVCFWLRLFAARRSISFVVSRVYTLFSRMCPLSSPCIFGISTGSRMESEQMQGSAYHTASLLTLVATSSWQTMAIIVLDSSIQELAWSRVSLVQASLLSGTG